MRRVEVEPSAQAQIENIFAYSAKQWDVDKATEYVGALFATMRAIAADQVTWPRIPSSFDLDGYVRKCGRHLIYWSCGADDVVRIFAVLHERMHQSMRLRDALDREP